jgi:U3 small nucleolar ribonucleoprotein protein IMP4
LIITILIGVTLDTEKTNIAPSQLKIVSEVKQLNVLSEILDLDLVDKAEDNYILISESDDSVARIHFINKFGDRLNFQINVKKILEVTND